MDLIIDVRTAIEHSQDGRDALNIPYDEIPDRMDEINRDARILLYCRSGRRSGIAASFLKAHGYDAHNLGGITDAKRHLDSLH